MKISELNIMTNIFRKLVVDLKSNRPLVGPGTIGGKPSVGGPSKGS